MKALRPIIGIFHKRVAIQQATDNRKKSKETNSVIAELIYCYLFSFPSAHLYDHGRKILISVKTRLFILCSKKQRVNEGTGQIVESIPKKRIQFRDKYGYSMTIAIVAKKCAVSILLQNAVNV